MPLAIESSLPPQPDDTVCTGGSTGITRRLPCQTPPPAALPGHSPADGFTYFWGQEGRKEFQQKKRKKRFSFLPFPLPAAQQRENASARLRPAPTLLSLERLQPCSGKPAVPRMRPSPGRPSASPPVPGRGLRVPRGTLAASRWGRLQGMEGSGLKAARCSRSAADPSTAAR